MRFPPFPQNFGSGGFFDFRPAPSRILSALPWVGAVAVLGIVVWVSATHWSDAEHFALQLERAEPGWMALAALFQIGTYVCAGASWNSVAASAGHPIKVRFLARLSIIKLTVAAAPARDGAGAP